MYEFFDAVKAQTNDHRFNDPNYLSAKYVVWLAQQFAKHYDYDRATGEMAVTTAEPLDFLSVGVMMSDPGDIEYRYEVECSHVDQGNTPTVKCFDIYANNYVEIPDADATVSSAS